MQKLINKRLTKLAAFRYFIITFLSALLVIGCHSDFLDKQPPNVLTVDQVFSSPDNVVAHLGNLYNRIFDYYDIDDRGQRFAELNIAFPSYPAHYNMKKVQEVPFNQWTYWDTHYLHDINLFLIRIRQADKLSGSLKTRFLGEGQFIRALFFFNEVKTMGGFPLVLDTLVYNFSGDVSYLYRKRNPEFEVYDFVIKEADSAARNLPKDPSIKSRATWGAAMTLKSTAALFAASIAQHGINTPDVSLPGNIVGIPSTKAKDYYQIALDAAEEIINSNEYSLYLKFPSDLEKNFAQLFVDPINNPEIIFGKEHNLTDDGKSLFTVQNQPRSLRESSGGAAYLNPTLNLVQSFEILDNTTGILQTKNPDGSYIVYEHPSDIFKNRDARLGGTVMLPGSEFKGEQLDFQAGVYLPQNSEGQRFMSGSVLGERKLLPGESEPIKIVGMDGPLDLEPAVSQTGFGLRKYVDPTTGAGNNVIGSAVMWIRYRYAQVLLNAAEAAWALGDKARAAKYINKIRQRAGFEDDLDPNEIDFAVIVRERLNEFAFEGHRIWDLKRWRLAHIMFDGNPTDLDHPEIPWASSTQSWGLWPYKISNPGQPDDGKWVFRRILPSPVENYLTFQLGNYYSRIGQGRIGANPKLIENPNQ